MAGYQNVEQHHHLVLERLKNYGVYPSREGVFHQVSFITTVKILKVKAFPFVKSRHGRLFKS